MLACDSIAFHPARHSCEFEWVVTTLKSVCVEGICDTVLESMPKPLRCSLEQEVIRVRKELGEAGNTLWNWFKHLQCVLVCMCLFEYMCVQARVLLI